MKIRWSTVALTDLRSISSFTMSRRTARVVRQRITRLASTLAEHPFAGRAIPEHRDESLREVIVWRYRVCYRVHADRVEILRRGELPEFAGESAVAYRSGAALSRGAEVCV